MSQYENLLQYALRILTKKRYTVLEIRKKLITASLKFDENCRQNQGNEDQDNKENKNVILRVIERLIELNYLNDESYVQDYIAQRVRFKPRGKILLLRELKNKGVDKAAITKIFENQKIDELEMALRVLEKKSRFWKKYPFDRQKNKAFLLLSSKGFERDAIYKAVKQHYNRDEVES